MPRYFQHWAKIDSNLALERGKEKYKGLPPELRAQWDDDRKKKAERKRLRAIARQEAAADPFAHHKKGKKSRKAMLKAATISREDSDYELPNRIDDLMSLVEQIRKFVGNLGGSNNMTLPAMDTKTRAAVHEIARVFNLTSKSSGKNSSRHITLYKKSITTPNIKEGHLRSVLKRHGAIVSGGFGKPQTDSKSGGGKFIKPREGEEVGKVRIKKDFSLTWTVVNSVRNRLPQRLVKVTSDLRCWLQWDGPKATRLALRVV